MPFLKAEDPSMEVFPMVNNFNGTDWVETVPGFSTIRTRGRNFERGKHISFFGPLSRLDGRFRSVPRLRAERLCRAVE